MSLDCVQLLRPVIKMMLQTLIGALLKLHGFIFPIHRGTTLIVHYSKMTN